MPRTKQQPNVRLCPICGEPYDTDYQANFEIMACRAGWNMSFEPRMNMCRTCNEKLLEACENWFKNSNKTNIYKKFTEEWKENKNNA